MVVFGLALALIATGAHAEQPPDDLHAWRFDRVDFSYSNGASLFLQVQQSGKNLLWDPASGVAATVAPAALSRLTRVSDLLSPSSLNSEVLTQIERESPGQSSKDPEVTPFSAHRWKDGALVVQYANPRIDRLSWDAFYEIFAHGHSQGRFYAITDESHGNYKAARFETQHDGYGTPRQVETLAQEIGPNGVAGVDLLPGDHFLFTAIQFSQSPCMSGCDYVIKLDSAPNRPISFDNHVYLVPYQIMHDTLAAAGPSLLARYTSVRKLIKTCKLIKADAGLHESPMSELFSTHKE